MKSLPTLYKQTKTGAIQQYKVSTEADKITVEQGQVDGLKQNYYTTCKPKNVGKANETTGKTQAESEAKSKWDKKIKGGYTEDPSGEITVKLPMKVKSYWDQKKNVIFPCYGSPKLNGLNGTFRLEDDVLSFTSRGGESFDMLPHIEKFVKAELNILGTPSINCEIYRHGMHLQDISAAINKHNANTPKLEVHVFELPDIDKEYKDKVSTLLNSAFLTPEIREFFDHESLEKYHDECVEAGYEGIVIRNKICKYEYNVRSSNVFKMKIAQDAEYKVIGYKLDKNGHAVFSATTSNNGTFNVKLKGTKEERLAMAAEADNYIGKWLKVEFEMLSKAGIPQKPVGIMFRECDAEGNPTE